MTRNSNSEREIETKEKRKSERDVKRNRICSCMSDIKKEAEK